MKRHALLTLLLVPLLSACPGPDPVADGGVDGSVELDAGADGGTGEDGGTLPDGGGDAGTSDAGTDAGEELPPHVIEEVLPPRGGVGGGTRVSLQGSGFLYGVSDRATEATRFTSIRFGGNTAQDFLVVDDRVIDVRVPPGVAGTVDVTLTSPRGTIVCSGCFTYYEELDLLGASPATGPEEGGTEVVLSGQGFTEGVTVLFGTQRSPEVTFVSSRELRVLSPRGIAGQAVDVVVYDQGGVGLLRRAFAYQPSLRVTAVVPPLAELGSPVEVELVGSGLGMDVEVDFGGLAGTVLEHTVDGTLRVATPPGVSPGAVDVTVRRGDASWTVRDGFAWVEVGGPVGLFAASPRLIPSEGGQTTLVGQGFAQSLQVFVGGNVVTPLSRSANTLVIPVPAQAVGAPKQLEVEVRTATASYLLSLTYRARLFSVAPAAGDAAGGTAATLAGAALPADPVVHVGALAATAVQASSETSVGLVTPRGSTGLPVDVWLFSASDPEDEVVLPAAFQYSAPVAIGRVTPDNGAIAGNTLVTVLGEGFGEGTVVNFGGRRAKDIKVLDAHTLTCRIPKGEPGTVDVELVRNAERDLLPGGFSYFDPRSLSGGLSGGPLTGTLNVTVLESTGGMGTPVPLAHVMLGADPDTPFQGFTDHRGQHTFSDPALVKAQVVTVFKEGFESVTVTAVNASNLTVFMGRTGGGGPPAPPSGGITPSLISGHISGFKPPRPLASGETLEARVFVADTSIYATPPFRGPRNRQGEVWRVTEDGGEYRVLTIAGRRAVYAIFGIASGTSFEPYLMGLHRNIPASPEVPQFDRDIVLDMHLDSEAPIRLEGGVTETGGGTAETQIFSWLDLGAEGLVPNPFNWNTGTGFESIIKTSGGVVEFPGFPALDGSNFIFTAVAFPLSSPGVSLFFRRQPGALEDGISVGPMLQVPTFTSPTTSSGLSTNLIAWTSPPGPTPDLHHVSVFLPTMMGPLDLWTVVLPGNETQVTLPQNVVDQLRREWGDTQLFVSITSSRSPRFRYDQWSYDTLGGASWTSYSTTQSQGFFP